jgi:hypothetical protein
MCGLAFADAIHEMIIGIQHPVSVAEASLPVRMIRSRIESEPRRAWGCVAPS